MVPTGNISISQEGISLRGPSHYSFYPLGFWGRIVSTFPFAPRGSPPFLERRVFSFSPNGRPLIFPGGFRKCGAFPSPVFPLAELFVPPFKIIAAVMWGSRKNFLFFPPV